MKKESSTSTNDSASVPPEKVAARPSSPLFLFARLNLNMETVYHIFSPEDSKSPPRFSQERAFFVPSWHDPPRHEPRSGTGALDTGG